MGIQQIGNAFSLKIALLRYAVIFAESRPGFFAQYLFDLTRVKDIVLPFRSVAVRILRAVKPAVRRGPRV